MNSSPHSREPSRPSSVLEDVEGDSVMTTSRPTSVALMPQASACLSPTSPPSLRDILTSSAPPPYTLAAFMAFLSQNHCLETLEFTMDAERYRSAYSSLLMGQCAGSADGPEHVCCLWQKLMNAYILPYGHREVNLPAHVRDRLLSFPSTPVPPHPSELDEAARIVYELMNDSVMGPFLASMTVHHEDLPEAHEHRHSRSKLRIPRESSSGSDDSSRSPRMNFLPMLNIPWTSESKSSASSTSDAADRGMLTDDSANSPSGNEPVTPPTTPPLSDWGFSSPPAGLHKLSSHNSGWKKMGAKLGLNRMGRSKRGHSSSATSVPADVTPIHEDTVTASPDYASPAPKKGAGSRRALQTQTLTPRTSWEEPHPGQRYSISVVANARPGAAANVSHSSCNNGAGKAGVAAKGYAPYPTRNGWAAGAARKFAPPRSRTPSLRPLKIPYQDANTNNQVRLSHPQPPLSPPSDRHPHKRVSMAMTDYSGLLTPSLTITDSEEDALSYMSVDMMDDDEKTPSPPPHRLESDEYAVDPYGWEAELDRKMHRNPVGECCPPLRDRRGGGGVSKKTLLQRVLSFGPRE
ncbi:hypothetical protein N0V88_000438 [Collariella sp. IMI 366227]|nr:hypothetical protein N0V88_000438 [Collariella sp. IMI 366227]